MFGPLMIVWFGCLAGLGIHGITQHPDVVAALNPAHAWSYLHRNGFHSVFVLGAVFLVLTGRGSALRRHGSLRASPHPDRLVERRAAGVDAQLHGPGSSAPGAGPGGGRSTRSTAWCPSWALYPMVIVATVAATIASQALISGAFSLTQQAMQLGFVPRMRLIHTSRTDIGQIYLPGINWTLWLGTVALVLAFRTSDALASTYGVAVTGHDADHHDSLLRRRSTASGTGRSQAWWR